MKALPRILFTLGAAGMISGCARHSGTAVHQDTRSNFGVGNSASTDVETASTPGTAFYSSDIFSSRPEDNDLVSRLRAALMQEPSLAEAAPALSIGASNGTVSLFGTARSQSEKDRMEAIAREMEGVREVQNRLQVVNIATATPQDALSATSRGDEGTVSDINTRAGVTGSAMQSAAETATTGIDSTAEQLAATSRADEAARIYEPDRHSATGPVTVEVHGSNEIDQQLAGQLTQELRADASLSAALARVKLIVSDARVTLLGSVRNDVQKREIEAAVQRITGVSTIDNQLRIDASGTDPLQREP